MGRFVARYVALKDTANVNRMVSTAFAMLATGGALAMIITIVLLQFVFGALHVEPQYQHTARLALLIAGLNMASILPLGVFSSVLVSLDRFDVLSGVTVVGELARGALVVACLRQGYGLVGLAVVGLLITVAEYGVIGAVREISVPAAEARLEPGQAGSLSKNCSISDCFDSSGSSAIN